MISPKILDKLKKCHALASSNHAGESEAARLAVSRLLEANGLSISNVAALLEENNVNTERVVRMKGMKYFTLKYKIICNIIDRFFFVTTLLQKSSDSVNIDIGVCFVGRDLDTIIAVDIFNFLCREIEIEWDKFKLEFKDARKLMYLQGVKFGLAEQLESRVSHNEQEYGLVVVDNCEERLSYINKKFQLSTPITTNSSKKETAEDRLSVQAGFEAGKAFQLEKEQEHVEISN